MSQTPKKSQNKSTINDSLIEQLRDMSRGVAKSVTQDVVSGVASDALSSLFGTPKKSGEMKPGQAVNLQPPTPQTAPEDFPLPQAPEFWPPPRFRRQQERQPAISPEVMARLQAQEAQVTQKIEEIRFELKQLMVTLKTVDSEIEKTVNEQLVDPGVYHLNFLDRLKTMLRLLRQNLNDSASWLSVMRARKKQRTYWALYKKKGTEFGLNPDRVVSTQVG